MRRPMIKFRGILLADYDVLYNIETALALTNLSYEEYVIYLHNRPYNIVYIVTFVNDSTLDEIDIGFIKISREYVLDFLILPEHQGTHEEAILTAIMEQFDNSPVPGGGSPQKTLFTVEVGPGDDIKKKLLKKLGFEDKKHVYKRKP
jgi:hypothetical protein